MHIPGVGKRMSRPGWKQLRQPPSALRSPSPQPLKIKNDTSRAGLAGLISSQPSPQVRWISAAP